MSQLPCVRFVACVLGLVAMVGCGSSPGTGDDAGTDARTDGSRRVDALVIDVPGSDVAFDARPGCAGLRCDPGTACREVDGGAACVALGCDEIACPATASCVPAPGGVGHVCRDLRCTDSLECEPGEYCNGTVCTPDVCTPGAAVCTSSGGVQSCAPDGSGTQVRYTCGGGAYYTSACTNDPAGAYCPCEDDWDCPANTACEAGRCAGTGVAPTCRLPPAPFASVLPSIEPGFPWGGTGPSARNATRSPFADSAQVVMTPLVVNLDDDNRDGRIDERDSPEIVFLSFCNSDYSSNGVLRAVHGGGPNRGKDFFATCGGTLWHEGDALSASCPCDAADLDSTAGLAAGDLDGDGVPEIVAMSETDHVRIYSNRGVLLAEHPTAVVVGSGAPNISPTIANLDGVGPAEIVAGRVVFTLGRDSAGRLSFVDRFEGTLAYGRNAQGPISCVANVAGNAALEIVAGSTVYRLPAPPAGVTRQSQCPVGNASAFCRGELVVVWDGVMVNGASVTREGFCAVADVLGADRAAAPGPSNPPDGTPEVVVIADGRLQIFDGATGTMHRDIALDAGGNGGAPNIDDFDGDGFPEIGTAFGSAYAMVDLQPATAACPAWPNVFDDAVTGSQGNPTRRPPTAACTRDADCGNTAQFACNETIGRCVCLHNGWRRKTEDDSSRVTGSTVFDFNGDGAAEIVYNDECYFRIYDGQSGAVLFREPSESRTRTENPVVADVDNDGNAEIVFATSNESGYCSDRTLAPRFNNGIEVWGDSHDLWVPARRVWNEHAYHVTNVLESGGLPAREPEHWRSYAGRSYNTFRSQPRSFGIAPNLVVERVQTSAAGGSCGALSTTMSITARVANVGDVRVGPDVLVGFYGIWTSPALDAPLYANASMAPLRVPLGTTLEPGNSVLVTAMYDARFNAPMRLPDRVRVVADDTSAERECVENDNARTGDVQSGSGLADLAVELGAVGGACPNRTFPTTVRNTGSASVSNVLVRYYLGDPAAGGRPFHEERVSGPIAAGASVTVTPTIAFPLTSAVVYVVVDPDDAIAECNDANNTAHTGPSVTCVPG